MSQLFDGRPIPLRHFLAELSNVTSPQTNLKNLGISLFEHFPVFIVDENTELGFSLSKAYPDMIAYYMYRNVLPNNISTDIDYFNICSREICENHFKIENPDDKTAFNCALAFIMFECSYTIPPNDYYTNIMEDRFGLSKIDLIHIGTFVARKELSAFFSYDDLGNERINWVIKRIEFSQEERYIKFEKTFNSFNFKLYPYRAIEFE